MEGKRGGKGSGKEQRPRLLWGLLETNWIVVTRMAFEPFPA
jgi:hypothetical protein